MSDVPPGPPRLVDLARAAMPLADGPYRLRRWRHGLILYNSNDLYLGRSIDAYGEYCQGEVEVLCQLLRPGDLVVDGGANIGALTLPLAKAVGRQGAVIAFEPQRLIFQMLNANLALNELYNVRAYAEGLGNALGKGAIRAIDPASRFNFGSEGIVEPGKGEPIVVRTIDSLDLPRCRLIKLDIQGMELEALRGARATIARHRPALYVENEDRAKSPTLIGEIQSLGYRLWWHCSMLFNPGNFAGRTDDLFPGLVCPNLICLPRDAKVDIQQPEILDPSDWPAIFGGAG